MCVSARKHISRITRASFTKFFAHVAYRHGSVLLRRGNEISRGRGYFGPFLSIDNALYSIAFGTHTRTAEPIDMLFWIKTRVGLQREAAIFGVVRAFKSIGNLRCTGRCSVTARAIIQSPITACSRRDYSVCHASANSILKNAVYYRLYI